MGPVAMATGLPLNQGSLHFYGKTAGGREVDMQVVNI